MSSSLRLAAAASAREPAVAPEVWCFSVQAEPSAGLMPRLIELFAKRNLVPTRWHSQLVSLPAPEIAIDLQMAGIDGDLARYIASCMRQVVGVSAVLISAKRSV